MAHWTYDIIEDRLTWSYEMYGIYGIPFENPVKNYNDFIMRVHPDDRAMIKGSRTENQSLNKPRKINYRIIRPDGSVRLLISDAAVTFGADGQPRTMSGVTTDVTDEVDSVEINSRLIEIIDATTDFIATADAHGRILSMNKAARAMIGIGEDEDILKLTVADLRPPPVYRRVMEEAFPAAIRDGVWSGETVLMHRSGREIPVSQVLLSHKGVDGEVKYLSTIMRDISGKKTSEEALRSSELKFRTLVEHMPDTTWVYIASDDECFSSIYIGPQIRLMGYTQQEWTADRKMWLKSLHPDDRQRVVAEFEKARAGDAPLLLEYRLIARDGGVRWFRDDAVLLRDGLREPVFFQGVMQDITERKDAEEALIRKTGELDAVNKELHELAMKLAKVAEEERKHFAEILHEKIGQNLVAIKLAYKGCMKDCRCETDEMRQRMNDIFSLLDDSISTSRTIAAGLYPAPLKDVSLVKVISWYVDTVLKPSGIEVLLDIDGECEGLIGDVKQVIFSVIRESFQNILKYSGAASASVSCRKTGALMRVVISDNGAGFSPEEIKLKSGRGFGLLLVREWVKSIGGVSAITSAPGKGTEISFEFRP